MMTIDSNSRSSRPEGVPRQEGLFLRYASLLDPADLNFLSQAYELAAAELHREGVPLAAAALEKAILLEGLGRRMGAGEIAKIVAKRMRRAVNGE